VNGRWIIILALLALLAVIVVGFATKQA